jgi:hypothetical protein
MQVGTYEGERQGFVMISLTGVWTIVAVQMPRLLALRWLKSTLSCLETMLFPPELWQLAAAVGTASWSPARND